MGARLWDFWGHSLKETKNWTSRDNRRQSFREHKSDNFSPLDGRDLKVRSLLIGLHIAWLFHWALFPYWSYLDHAFQLSLLVISSGDQKLPLQGECFLLVSFNPPPNGQDFLLWLQGKLPPLPWRSFSLGDLGWQIPARKPTKSATLQILY